MNRVIYLITATCVGIAILAAFIAKPGFEKLGISDAVALISVIVLSFGLTWTLKRLGFIAWFNSRAAAREDVERDEIRKTGKIPLSRRLDTFFHWLR